MITMKRTCLFSLTLATLLVALAPTAQGVAVLFQVDTNLSAVTLGGSAAGIAFTEQGPGSLTTHFMGTVQAEVTPASISFPGGSVVVAMTNGNWQPLPGGGAGAAPANYGIKVSAGFLVSGTCAARGVTLDIINDSLPVSQGVFPAQGLNVIYRTNPAPQLDFRYSGLLGSGSGSNTLTSASTNSVATNATLVVEGTNLVMTIPFDVTGYGTLLNTNDVVFRLQGQIVARATAPASGPSVPLVIQSWQRDTNSLTFTIETTPGLSFTILGSTNLVDWPVIVDQFTATTNPTTRIVAPPPEAAQFFRVRQD
jgi:hypothetical protein